MIAVEIVHTSVHIADMKIAGVEWDEGNWPKCGKHGVSQEEIEFVLENMTFRIADPNPMEQRFRTAGRAQSGRVVFVVYTYRTQGRTQGARTFLRPISARFMHPKEVREYEQIEKAMADTGKR